MIIGKRIKEARIKKKMSQEELGDLLGVTKVSVCGYEKGTRTPTMKTFLKLIEILDLDPNQLLGRDVRVITERDPYYAVRMAHEDIAIIAELKHYPKLHARLRNEPVRFFELLNRKLK